MFDLFRLWCGTIVRTFRSRRGLMLENLALWRCDEEERLTELEIDLMLKPMNYGSSPDSHTPCLRARLAYKRNC